MTAAERLIILGQEQGMQIGKSAILFDQMEQKFGTLPPQLHKKIKQANSDTLSLWASKILKANNLESIFEEERK
jgi:hypothetical protein